MWRHQPHSLLAMLRKQLKVLKFQEKEPFLWTPPATWAAAFRPTVFNLDARRGSGQELEVQLHNIRLMYKIQCFEGFLSSGHRDAKAVSLNFSPAQLRHRFGRIDLKRCRAWLSSSAPARALMTGSFWSPAACGTRVDGLDQMCPMCCTALGTFQHCFWECPKNKHAFYLPDYSPLLLRL